MSAFIATAFAQETPGAASLQWRSVADQIRPKVPKLADIPDNAEPDVLAYMTFPKEHRAKLHSTNPIERLNGEIKRRIDVVDVRRANDSLDHLLLLPHSPATTPSCASSAPCCSSRTTSGPCSGQGT